MQICVGPRSHAVFVVSGLLLALSGPQAFAAGFAIRAQSASSIGTAGASDVAGTSDISAMFSNPASLSAFKGQNVSVGGAYVIPKAEFKDGKRTIATTGIESVNDEESSKSSDDFVNSSFIPAFYGSYEVNEDIVAGVSLTAPFGTNSDYGKDWIGRYQGTKTELEVINLDLAASYKIADNLKLGFGIQVQRGSGLIEGASNFGAAVYGGAARIAGDFLKANAAKNANPTDPTVLANFAAAQTALAGNSQATTYVAAASAAVTLATNYLGALLAAGGDTSNGTVVAAKGALDANPLAVSYANAAGAAAASQTTVSAKQAAIAASFSQSTTSYLGGQLLTNEGHDDIYAEYEGKDIAYGFTFGVLYSPIPELDLGFSYRSQVVHKTEGDYTLSGETPTAEAYANSRGLKHDAKLNLTIPDIISFGANYKGIENLNLYANASLTRWSKFYDINVRPDTTDNVQVILDWEDVWYVGVGASYKIDSNFTVRGGLASDNSPTTDSLRSPRSPDDNRKFISLGGRYESEGWSVDAGLLHTTFRAPKLDLKDDAYPKANGRGDLSGEYTVSADTFMVQYNKAL